MLSHTKFKLFVSRETFVLPLSSVVLLTLNFAFTESRYFQSLEVVSRYRDPQLQVTENLWDHLPFKSHLEETMGNELPSPSNYVDM